MNNSDMAKNTKKPNDKLVQAVEKFWDSLRVSSERIASGRDDRRIAELRYSEIENNYAVLDKKFQALVSQTGGFAIKDDKQKNQIRTLEQERKALSELLTKYEYIENENDDLKKDILELKENLGDKDSLSDKYLALGKDYDNLNKESRESQIEIDNLKEKLSRSEEYEGKFVQLSADHNELVANSEEGALRIGELSETVKELNEVAKNFELSKNEIIRKNKILNTNADIIADQKNRISELESVALQKKTLDEKLEISNEEINGFHSEIDQLNNDKLELAAAVAGGQKDRDLLRSKNAEDIEKLKGVIHSSELAIDESSVRISELKKEKAELFKELKDSEQNRNEIISELKRNASVNKEHLSEILNLRKCRDDYERNEKQAEEYRKKYEQAVAENEKFAFASQELKNKIEDLEDLLQARISDLNNMNQENVELQKTARDAEVISTMYEEAESNIQVLKQQLTEANNDYQMLQENKDKNKIEIGELKAAIDAINLKNTELTKEINRLNLVEKQFDVMREDVRELRERGEETKAALSAKESAIIDLESSSEYAESKYNGELNRLTLEIEESAEKNDSLNEEIERLNAVVVNIEEISKQSDSYRVQAEQVKNETIAKEKEIVELRSKLSSVGTASSNEIDEMKNTIEEITDQNIELELKNEKLTLLTTEITELEKQVVHTNKLEKEYKAQFERLNEKIGERDEIIARSDEKSQEIQDSISSLETENEDLKKSANDLLFLKQQMNITNSQLTLSKSEAMKLRDQVANLESRNKEIEKELSGTTTNTVASAELKQKLEAAENLLSGKSELIETSERRIAELKNEQLLNETKINSFSEKYDSLNKLMGEKTDKIEELDNKLVEINAEQSASDKEKAKLIETIEAYIKKVEF